MLINWESLTVKEPRLAQLEEAIRLVRPGARRWRKTKTSEFCANWVWYSYFKPQLVRLVGWSAAKPEIRTEEAYDVAYDYLYSLLPDCKHKNPLCV